MEKVMLDTNFWIHMEDHINDFETFYNIISNEEDIEVYFSFGNFIDLIKADDQDALSKIIANSADVYVPPLPPDGDKFRTTSNPIEIIPDKSFREEFRSLTRGDSEEETLKKMFRLSDWTPTGEFIEGMEQYRSIHEDYEFKYLKAVAFEDYLEESQDGEMTLLQHKVDIIEFVKKIIYAHRIALLSPEENIDPNDIADLSICVHSIVTECDHLLIEEKWANVEIINKVTDELDSDHQIKTYTEFDNFIDGLESVRS